MATEQTKGKFKLTDDSRTYHVSAKELVPTAGGIYIIKGTQVTGQEYFLKMNDGFHHVIKIGENKYFPFGIMEFVAPVSEVPNDQLIASRYTGNGFVGDFRNIGKGEESRLTPAEIEAQAGLGAGAGKIEFTPAQLKDAYNKSGSNKSFGEWVQSDQAFSLFATAGDLFQRWKDRKNAKKYGSGSSDSNLRYTSPDVPAGSSSKTWIWITVAVVVVIIIIVVAIILVKRKNK